MCRSPATLACRIVIKRFQAAFAKAVAAWKFVARDNLVWDGCIAGPDRLRFLGMISRYRRWSATFR